MFLLSQRVTEGHSTQLWTDSQTLKRETEGESFFPLQADLQRKELKASAAQKE